jgi:putative DNA primase/helicase
MDVIAVAQPALYRPVGFNDFVSLNLAPRKMLLDPILPERSLAMLYAPRGLGKTQLGLSVGLATASGSEVLRWSAPRPRRVLYIDGEMPVVSLQERLKALALGMEREIPNEYFQILAADNVDGGINLGTDEGQRLIEPLLDGLDLLILDNLSTLCPTRSESASDAWTPIQEWLLGLRRRGISVLFIHHAGNNGRQRGTSRREDALDTVIALRRPGDYSPEQEARFEVHFEKLRNRIDPAASVPFEARLESFTVGEKEGLRWSCCDLAPPLLKQAAELFGDGMTVREVATALGISKSEAGRLRIKASGTGLIALSDEAGTVDPRGKDIAAGS